MPIRSIDRPLTLLEDHFAIAPDANLTIDRVSAPAGGGDVVVGLFLGAGYGVTDDLEIGLTLLRLTMSPSPNTGIDSPSGYVMYRLLGGPLEIAALAEMELPLNDAIDARAGIPMLLHLPPVASLRVEPSVVSVIATPTTIGVSIPTELRFQITDQINLAALANLAWPNLREDDTLLLHLGGMFAFTFIEANAAYAELRFSGLARSLALSGLASPRPAGFEWVATIDATIFLRSDPSQRFPDSPF